MELEAEDAKLVTLAKASRARIGSVAGAAVRDQDGRTYTAAAVDRGSLNIAALDLAVAMAVSSGATLLEAAAVTCEVDYALDLQAVRDVSGTGVPVYLASPAGVVREVVVS